MSRITVAIVNFNGRHLLERHLPAVVAQRGVDFDIVLADGGSSDGSRELLQSEYPAVRVLPLEGNPGFAAANNRILEATTTPLIALLNNDASPEPGWLAALQSAAADHPEFGMFASRMVFHHDPAVINSAGISLDRAGIAWDRHVGRRDTGPTGEVFGPSAGAALYRRKLFEEVGDFDESFFAYLEDVDLAWRARLAGWRCLYVAEATVRHEHSATGAEGSPFKNFHLGRNKVWTILKNYPLPQLLYLAPLIALYDLAAIPLTLLRSRDPAILRGRLAALWHWRTAWRQRRRIHSRRHISGSEFRRLTDGFQSPLGLYRRYRDLHRVLAVRDSPESPGNTPPL
ncbi:MAG: glycosyltransferase family 2 protein [Chloroflexota bacterium]|nr:glycosyltransferase family 2 protein [Chloroflexota bacterium]MDP6758208.1 glycosyltransferase family 2 protein [Chloroflexota bacterium]